MDFKIGDNVNWLFGEGGTYRIVATKTEPYKRVNMESVSPIGEYDYVIVKNRTEKDGDDMLSFQHVPKQHLEPVK